MCFIKGNFGFCRHDLRSSSSSPPTIKISSKKIGCQIALQIKLQHNISLWEKKEMRDLIFMTLEIISSKFLILYIMKLGLRGFKYQLPQFTVDLQQSILKIIMVFYGDIVVKHNKT